MKPNLSPRLSDCEEFPHCKPDVVGDAPQQGGSDVTAGVEGHRGAAPIRVAELLVGSLLSNLGEPEPFEQCSDLPRPQNRDVAHGYAAMVMVCVPTNSVSRRGSPSSSSISTTSRRLA
jgi:hypothetical protein